MSNKDIQNLIKLANTTRKAISTQEAALDRLVDAGILNKKGKYTKNYPELAAFSKK